MKTIGAILGLGFCFVLGLYISVFRPRHLSDFKAPTAGSFAFLNKKSASPSRDPASIRRNYDFSMLEGPALESATKQRLLGDAKVISSSGFVGIELGHFVMRGQNGQKTFACQRYSKISLTFEGEGVAVSGELPKMEVEGACEISSDINSISALMIPVSKIIGEPVAEGEFNFHEGQKMTVKFADVFDQWPKRWHLAAVKLFDEKSGEQVSIPAKEFKAYISKPLVVSF